VNRRRFLTLGGAAAAGLIWDPELLLWRPRKAMVVVPELALHRVSLAELVAVTYDKVVQERLKAGNYFWNDEVLIRALAGDAYRELDKNGRLL
jgi:hypothetical protein